MMKNPELLVPAGNLEKLKFAFAYGADAVYAGIPQFSLRARENGFRDESILEGAEYAHQLNKKFYLTANILGHNRKIDLFTKKVDEMMQAKPDALIMADPGLIHLVKEKHPEIPVHLSVQANVMNWAAVKFWHKMGVARIILSRELSIDDIKFIKDKVPEMELEAFVHGAICIAHSGRCLLSNYFGHRDANQGLCTNSCRWPYKLYATPADYYLEEKERPGEFMRIDEDEHGTYIMNARDLMAIEHLKEMWEAGLDSFKVEGRTKSVYYLSVTTKAYRQAIDDMLAGKAFNPDLLKELHKIHNRGYTPGFLVGKKDSSLQRYESGVTDIFTQEFGGMILESKPGRLLVSPKNKLSVGDKLEVMSPEKNFNFTIEAIQSETGEALESLHGGSFPGWLLGDIPQVGEYSIISKGVL
ncbi:MAG: U32 family peptidase C-terminal domain-containing protein [Deltaproteobacteria bacterium]|nr:U32 family peptidase C-terminal domain-containing protein [Deltaproteobacteria bacterium]